MDSVTKQILHKLQVHKVDLFSISEAKNILKDDFQDKINQKTKIFKTNIDDLKVFPRKKNDLIEKLEKQKQEALKKLDQDKKKYINILDNEVKEAKNLIKSINNKVKKHKSTLKEFEQQLKELDMKPSSSKLYEEIDSAIYLMNYDSERLQKAVDFVENNYEYKNK